MALSGVLDKVRQPLGRVDQFGHQVVDTPKRSGGVALPTVVAHAGANLAAQFSAHCARSWYERRVRAPRAQTAPPGGLSNVTESATSTTERLALFNLRASVTEVTRVAVALRTACPQSTQVLAQRTQRPQRASSRRNRPHTGHEDRKEASRSPARQRQQMTAFLNPTPRPQRSQSASLIAAAWSVRGGPTPPAWETWSAWVSTR